MKTVTSLQQIRDQKQDMTDVRHTQYKIIIMMLSVIMIIVLIGIPGTLWFINQRLKYTETEFERRLTETRISINNNMHEQIVFLKIMVLNDKVDIELAREIARSVYRWSRAYGQDPDLMLSLIKVESNFDPNAVSTASAEGLTQIMPFWYEIFKEPAGTFKEVNKSVEYGYRILTLYEGQYGTIDMALTAYNRGHYSIESDLISGKDPANGYALKILKLYNRLKNMNIGS